MTPKDQEARARALFRAFHKRDPKENELALLGDLKTPTVALECGPLVGLAYRALGDDNFHEFTRAGDPRVFVSWNGSQIYILGGAYRFTDRGFVR